MLCSSYHHKPSRISHPCRIDIHIVLHYSSLTSTSPWFFSLLCHKCLEVNHPSFSLQFRVMTFKHCDCLTCTGKILLILCYVFSFLLFFAFSIVHQLLFSCPITVKNAEHTCTRDITDEEAVSVFVSLYSLYTITVVVLFLVELLAKHPYLGVIHCCTWNDHWAQIPLFFSSTTTTISSVPYSLSLRLTNHVAKSYFLLLQPSN